MGLFSKLFGKSNSSIESEDSKSIESDDFLDEFERNTKQPRVHHYVFAQQAIPQSAHGDPDGFFTHMAALPAENISSLWDKVCEHCDEQEATELSSTDITVSGMILVESRALLFKMPPPIAPIESYAIAVIEDKRSGSIKARCVTFEKGDDNSTCIICEVTEDGTHLNRGGIPMQTLAEDKDYFVTAYQSVF